MPASIHLIHGLKLFKNTVSQLNLDAKRSLRAVTTRVTFLSHAELKEEFKAELDKPVPWLVNGYRYEAAKDLDNPVGKIIPRDAKRSEYIDSITRTGKLIPTAVTERARRDGFIKSSEYLTPTRAVKTNSRDNVGAGAYSRIRSKGFRRPGPKPPRGVYIKESRTRLLKVLSPSTYTRYQPKVNPVAVIDRVSAKYFDSIYDMELAKNIAKTLQKRLGR